MFQKEHRSKENPVAVPKLRDSFFRAVVRTFKSYKLGDLLVASSLISSQQLETALAEQKETGERLGKVLIRHGSVSAVQLYSKLAEQWCLKASAAGITLIMQSVTPTVALADSSTGSSSSNITAQFTLASAAVSPAYAETSIRRYPGLFGTQEVKSDDITAFKKWTDVISRFESQMKTISTSSPRIMLWKAEIQKLKDLSPREQIEGVNAFLNKVPYVEDEQNYGKTDYWATPIEFLSRGGDCEDFAIAKYASLRALGFQPHQLRVAIVQDEIRNIPHAILIVYSGDDNFVLDNQDKKVEYVSSVTRYKPIFSINSSSWWLYKA